MSTTRVLWLLVPCMALAGTLLVPTQEVVAKDLPLGTHDVLIPTTRGVELRGVLHLPEKASGVIVVIGSGRGYHMGLPFLVRTAEELQRVGVAALRFDWGYFTAKGDHSPDLSVEGQDLEAAIAFARKVSGIQHVILAGKSLGSIAAAMRAQSQGEDLAGLMLLTYPLHGPGDSSTLQPEVQAMQAWKKPLLIACGDADPYSDLRALYAYAAGFERSPVLVIAPGDHSFNGPGGKEDAATTASNVDLAAHGIARWARVWADALR